MTTPIYIFIIPYRDRSHHKQFFNIYIQHLLENYEKQTYKILFVHQNNNLTFNRGGIKNIGFLYVKKLYPNNYKNINLIFNDVDTLPYKKNILNYDTSMNEIKHFYGYTFALGGIVSIKAGDFEKINGFPNYWGWGFEDNVLQKRALSNKLTINRNQFYTIHSNEILHFSDEVHKIMDRSILEKHFNKSYIEHDGLNTLTNVKYKYNNDTQMLDVTEFKCTYDETNFSIYNHNIYSGSKIYKKKPNPLFKMSLIG